MKYVITILLLMFYSCSGSVTVKKHNNDISSLNNEIKRVKNENYALKLKFESILNRVIFLETQVINLKKRTKKISIKKETPKEIVVRRKIKDILSKKELDKIKVMDGADDNEEPVILTNSMLGKKIKNVPRNEKKMKKIKKKFKTTLKIRYKEALALHRSKQYFNSIEKFKQLIKDYRFVKTSLSDNFYYWIGENYLALNDIPLAREYFNKILKKYPKSNKVPDSIFKLGLMFERENKEKDAIKLYKKVIKNYPNTEATLLSKERLKNLGGTK